MKVSQNGIDYRIISGSTKIIDNLPAKVYELNYHEMQGIWLSERPELEISMTKIYGNTMDRIQKIFKTFSLRGNNLGILLSGEKGMGKSVFMRQTSIEAINRGLPVIVVNNNLPGLAHFIGRIEQECVVLFDEFEKNFLRDGMDDGDEQGGQTQFLSLFDGMDSGKKLFMISINSQRKLSEFFINRPGRFYYHFQFSYLGGDEVREYVKDNLTDYDKYVDKLVTIARFHDINYDILSAIVTELNNGFELKETLNDLNIDINESDKWYDYTFTVGGVNMVGNGWLNFNRDENVLRFSVEGKRRYICDMYVDMSGLRYDNKSNSYTLDRKHVTNIFLHEPINDNINDESKLNFTHITFTPRIVNGYNSLSDFFI